MLEGSEVAFLVRVVALGEIREGFHLLPDRGLVFCWRQALTPLIWVHVNPYGRFDLDMNARLALL